MIGHGQKMKILYDDGGFFLSYGGVARYFTEMIKRLPADFSWEFAMKSTWNLYLQQPPYNLPPHAHDVHRFIEDVLHGHSFKGVSYLYRVLARMFPRKFPSGELANEIALKRAFAKGDFDIFHLTGAHPVKDIWSPIVGKKPIVVTVYDLIPEILLGSKRVARCRRKLLQDVTHVIAISECTKQDLIRLYGVPAEKISVVHLGFMPLSSNEMGSRDWPKPYILYVGRRDGYKNFSFFVKAMAPLLKSTDLSLFCTGAPFSKQEKALFDELKVSERVFQGFVSDSEMPALFRNACAFVYPSVYEGFGIPILDAFSAGCPVVLSRCSCFPEVGGDAALYFDDGDAEALRTHVLRLKDDGVFRQEMISKGRERADLFSWEKCAEGTAKVYKKVLAN